MDKINKYILWQILDHCDIITIHNTSLLSKRIRDHMTQYICRHKYLHLNEHTKIHNKYATKIFITKPNNNHTLLYKNITHLSIPNFNEQVAPYFAGIEYLKCNTFDGYKYMFNKLKKFCAYNNETIISFNELLVCAPNIEIIKSSLNISKPVTNMNIKNLHICGRTTNESMHLLMNCKFDNITKIKINNHCYGSTYIVNISNYPKLQNLCVYNRPIPIMATDLHPHIKSIKNNCYAGLCNEYINLLLNAPNLEVLKLIKTCKELYDFCEDRKLMVRLRGRNDLIRDEPKISLNDYNCNHHSVKYYNVLSLYYNGDDQVAMDDLINIFPNLQKLRLGYLDKTKNLIMSKKNCNINWINKIRLSGVQLNKLYMLAKNITSLTHICVKSIGCVGKVATMSECPNIKTLYIYRAWCNGKSMVRVLNTLKDCFVNVETLLLPLNYANNTKLKWVINNFKNIKTVIYKSSCDDMKKYLRKATVDCDNNVQYIVVDNNALYYNFDNLFKFCCNNTSYHKIVIHLK